MPCMASGETFHSPRRPYILETVRATSEMRLEFIP